MCCCPEEPAVKWPSVYLNYNTLLASCMSRFRECTEAVSYLGNCQTWCCISQATLRLSTSAEWELDSWGSFHAPRLKSHLPAIKASGSSQALSLFLFLCDDLFFCCCCCLRCFSFFLWLFSVWVQTLSISFSHTGFIYHYFFMSPTVSHGTFWFCSRRNKTWWLCVWSCDLI